MQEISNDFLQVIAGDIEKLLIENQSQMDWAFRQLSGEMKISMSANLDSNGDGITVNYDLSFDLEPKPDPPEKHKVKYKHTVNLSQQELPFTVSQIISCPHKAHVTRDGQCSELQYCSFICNDRCVNGKRAIHRY